MALRYDVVARGAGAELAVLHEVQAPSYRVFEDRNAWESHWQQDLGQSGPADIDFANERVLCLYMGQKPTGGYAIAASAIHMRGSIVEVQLELNRPDPDAMLMQVITSPYAIYRIGLPPGAPKNKSLSFRFFTMPDSNPEPLSLKQLES